MDKNYPTKVKLLNRKQLEKDSICLKEIKAELIHRKKFYEKLREEYMPKKYQNPTDMKGQQVRKELLWSLTPIQRVEYTHYGEIIGILNDFLKTIDEKNQEDTQ